MSEHITSVDPAEVPQVPKTDRTAATRDRGNPFSGIRGLWINLTQPLRLLFFLPAFINIEQARKIVKTGRGKTWGIDDIFYVYPLLGYSVLAALATWLSDSPVLSQVLGTGWVLLLAVCL